MRQEWGQKVWVRQILEKNKEEDRNSQQTSSYKRLVNTAELWEAGKVKHIFGFTAVLLCASVYLPVILGNIPYLALYAKTSFVNTDVKEGIQHLTGGQEHLH